MRRQLLWSLAFVLSWLVAVAPAVGQELWERPAEPSYRVGIVIGDVEGQEAAVDDELSKLVEERQGVLVRRAPVDIAEEELSANAMTELRDRAHETYFHQGPEEARNYLEGRLTDRLAVTRVWMHDQEKAAALFETVIYLVRAQFDLGDEEAGERWLDRLVAALPAHEPDERAVPPNVVERWQAAVEEQASSQAVLDVTALLDECEVVLNGARTSQQLVPVAPGRTYLLSVGCDGEDRSAAHWVSAADDETRAVVAGGARAESSEIEDGLQQWATARGLDAVVYVGPGGCEQGVGETCVAAWRRAGDMGVEFAPLREGLVDEVVEVVRRDEQ